MDFVEDYNAAHKYILNGFTRSFTAMIYSFVDKKDSENKE
jgi:hypothetical protein